MSIENLNADPKNKRDMETLMSMYTAIAKYTLDNDINPFVARQALMTIVELETMGALTSGRITPEDLKAFDEEARATVHDQMEPEGRAAAR